LELHKQWNIIAAQIESWESLACMEITRMSDQPWFKFWSTDYLCDPDVDKLPLDAQGLLVRMWCVCNLQGFIPDDIEEIARLTRSRLQSCSLSYPLCKQFFLLRGGQLFSRRMEAEKEKSRIARENARKRVRANGSADGSANGSAQKARGPESHIPVPDKANTLALTAKAVPAGDSLIFIILPLNDKSEYPIDEKQVAIWEKLYPGVDVKQAVRDYAGWADAHPAKRKTRRGILGSVNSWLAKEQDNFKGTGESYGANRQISIATTKQERSRAAIQRAAQNL
jgi:hypothetical protein